ncbi:MAG: DEAD/DEAH box helicase family protein [Muribaculaceae bacterium]|nr:DEAD/DEAH box helicase family protein [Muribaculaceae bacterium]
MAKQKTEQSSFAFFDFLRQFYTQNRGRIRNRYKDLTKKFLDYNDKSKTPTAYLREPQFEALEIYVFLKEFCNNPQIYDLFDKWYKREGDFAAETVYTVVKGNSGQISLYDYLAEVNYKAVFDSMRKVATSYPNYIYALTMGLGKTVLMATCIFYEFLLANKYPKDTRYCHNALVFAPDKTVLESLREIVTMDKEKVVPPEYCRVLDQNIKFHFLDDTGITLNTLDNSDFNIIISNTQKIIKKRVHREKTPIEKLLEMSNAPQPEDTPTDIISSILGSVYTEENTRDEGELLSNQRFEKLTRLEQLGIYVDEAHHLFGGDLQKSMTSLRTTINDLSAALKDSGTRVVACYNYTGTPYLENTVLPEVVYSYGLKEAIANKYLKDVDIKGYDNVKSETFLKTVIEDFWTTYGGKTYEGLQPKLAIFGATIEEVVNEIRPAVEKVLAELGIPLDKILVNTGDTTVTKDNDIKAFNDLDVVGTLGSQKQFILLCNKGREGWNCRSLFGVALFRSPKSTIFVLQATMRCLRQITENQQKAIVRLSKENMDILNAELTKNFRVSIDDISNSGDGKHKELYKVKLLKPKKLTLKRISHKYGLKDKGYTAPIDFGIAAFDFDKYEAHVYEKESLTDQRVVKKTAVDLGGNREYSAYMLTAEIAKYLNLSCILIEQILTESVDGIDLITSTVTKYNDFLYDVVIPKIFNTLYEVTCETVSEEKTVDLLQMPEGKDAYEFLALPELVAVEDEAQFAKTDAHGKPYRNKSFHTDKYCFDSKSERECFLQYIFSDRVKEVFFTGMFTSKYNGLAIQYIDPETNAIRSYYPDFITTLDDGTIQIIEVKGDNKIDDSVVQAKAAAASEMATESQMQYIMLASTRIMKENII